MMKSGRITILFGEENVILILTPIPVGQVWEPMFSSNLELVESEDRLFNNNVSRCKILTSKLLPLSKQHLDML